jgi:flagellar hook-associated protein 3 FlgL
MRVTQGSALMRMVTDLQGDLLNLTNVQEQAASGKSLNQPSDNPTGTSEVLSLNSQIGRCQQYATNASDGVPWLDTASTALTSVTKALNQVQTDVLSGANSSASDASDDSALANEVHQIRPPDAGSQEALAV